MAYEAKKIKHITVIVEMADGVTEELCYQENSYPNDTAILADVAVDMQAKMKEIKKGGNIVGTIGGQVDLYELLKGQS